MPEDLVPLSAEAKSPHGSSLLTAAVTAGAAAGAGLRSRPPRSHSKSTLDPITGLESTGEASGVRLEAPGICNTQLCKDQLLSENLLTTFAMLLLDDEDGGALMRPAGGGGSMPSPVPDLALGLALSLLGMLMFTLMVWPSLNARSSCGCGSEFSYDNLEMCCFVFELN